MRHRRIRRQASGSDADRRHSSLRAPRRVREGPRRKSCRPAGFYSAGGLRRADRTVDRRAATDRTIERKTADRTVDRRSAATRKIERWTVGCARRM